MREGMGGGGGGGGLTELFYGKSSQTENLVHVQASRHKFFHSIFI